MSNRTPNAQLEGTNTPLAETLKTLRNELHLAQSQAAGENLLFEIDKVEVELKVILSNKATGKAGLEFYVVKAGGEIENSNETTHTIKLTLKVTDPSGNRSKVSGQSEQLPLKD